MGKRNEKIDAQRKRAGNYAGTGPGALDILVTTQRNANSLNGRPRIVRMPECQIPFTVPRIPCTLYMVR